MSESGDIVPPAFDVGDASAFIPVLIDDPAIVNLVNHGLGLTVLSKLPLDATHVAARALPLDPPYYRELGILLRSLENAAKFARAFVEEACRYITGLAK